MQPIFFFTLDFFMFRNIYFIMIKKYNCENQIILDNWKNLCINTQPYELQYIPWPFFWFTFK